MISINTLKTRYLEKYSESSNYINSILSQKPELAIIAGSGFSDYFDQAKPLHSFDYSDIPNFPQPSVEGHSGKLIIAGFAGKICMIFMGRKHIYEGASVDEIASFSIISYLLGINNIIFTNAAGGLSPRFELGSAMILTDSINLLYKNECELFDEFGLIDDLYSKDWRNNLQSLLINNAVLCHSGTYLSTSGPSYETPAEIRFFRKIGADAAGMSTVIEAATAKRLGMNCLAISLISNCLSEVATQKVDHEEVLLISKRSKVLMQRILEFAVIAAGK